MYVKRAVQLEFGSVRVYNYKCFFSERCATVAASNLGVPKKRRGGCGGVPGAPEPYIFYHGAQIISLPIARALIILAWIPKCYRALEL